VGRACHGRRKETAALLLARGGDLNWIGSNDLIPPDAAEHTGPSALVHWLRQRGARSAGERGR
jgi:hypothetical protein